MEYSYSVEHNTYSDYRVKQELPIALPNGTICKRVVIKRYGVRLEFFQVGKIGIISIHVNNYFKTKRVNLKRK